MRCQIVVRSSQGTCRWTASEWLAVQLMACVSVEPKTWSDLATALRTYRPQHALMAHAAVVGDNWGLPVLEEQGDHETWCVLDLVGRTIVVSANFCDIDARGGCHEWEPTDEDPEGGWYRVTEWSLPQSRVAYLHFPPHWKFFRGRADWRSIVERRYRQALAEPVVDLHQVLWGEPLWQFLAEAVRSAENATSQSELARQIHIRWMLTPHPLLVGHTPQQALMGGCSFVENDLEMRRNYWTLLKQPPQPIPRDSDAYRYAPYCEVHHALNFDYIRTLLEEAWQCRETMAHTAMRAWIDRLEHRSQKWWESPSTFSDSGMTNRELWSTLRQRIPLTGSGCTSDPDCPICRGIQALQLGPSFEFICWGVTDPEDEPIFAKEYVDIPWLPWQEDPLPDDSGRRFPTMATALLSPPSLGDCRRGDESGEERTGEELDMDDVADICSALDSFPPASPGTASILGVFGSTSYSSRQSGVDTSSAHRAEQYRPTNAAAVAPSAGVAALDADARMARLRVAFPLAELVSYLQAQPGHQPIIDRVNDLYERLCSAYQPDTVRSAARELCQCLTDLAKQFPSIHQRSQEAQSLIEFLVANTEGPMVVDG